MHESEAYDSTHVPSSQSPITASAHCRPRLQFCSCGAATQSADGDWLWAQGKIEGQEIVVWNDQVAVPAAVRYAWAFNPLLSVENSSGLPLRTFRTDTGSEK